MKRIGLILGLVSAIGLAKAQQTFSKDQLDVQQIIVNVFDALSNRDAMELQELCTADVRFYEYGKIRTIGTLIDLPTIRNIASDFKRINKFDFLSTTLQSNTT